MDRPVIAPRLPSPLCLFGQSLGYCHFLTFRKIIQKYTDSFRSLADEREQTIQEFQQKVLLKEDEIQSLASRTRELEDRLTVSDGGNRDMMIQVHSIPLDGSLNRTVFGA